MKSIIVFASGGGSNFEVIYNNTKNNKIENSYISLLISNNPKSKAVKFAKANNIDIFILNKVRFPNYGDYITKLNEILLESNPSLIVLAGYMKLIPKETAKAYNGKIINIHPGKLPEFGGKGMYGMNVHKATIDSGKKSTAITIHYVNEVYDEGMIILEKMIRIEDDDTPDSLARRVLTFEHQIYSKVINKLLNGKNSND